MLLLLLGAAWLLREMLPADPSLSLATREGPPAPPAAEPPPDPTPALKAAFSTEQSRERILKVELSLVEAELKKRIADCKPPEQPKPPPQVAVAPPPPKPAPAPAPAPTPAPRQTRPNDDRLRLPAPTNDYSFMSGCWRTDPFRHEPMQGQPGVSSYCFDANGNGQLEWRRGRTACRTRARRASMARRCASATAIRRATTARAGTPTSSSASAAPTTSRNAAAARRAGSARSTWTVNLHKLN